MTGVRERVRLLRAVFALALLLALGGSTATASAALQADYAFDDTLTSSVGTAPALTPAGACPPASSFATETVNGVADRVLTFPLGCGLQLASAGVFPRDSYSVAVLFRFTNVGPTFGDGYHRIFDPTPGTLDNGIYETNGKLNFFQNSIGRDNLGAADFVADQYTQVVVTRDAASGTVVGYVDGVQQWSVTDSGNDALITAEEMPRFLVDNFTEDSAGAVARLRLYDAPLTAAEVAALDGNVLAPADLSVTTTADKNPVYLGQDLVYSVALSNAGPGPSGGVVVTDPLPAGVDFVSASPGCAEAARTVTCDVGTVTADTPVVLQIVVHPTVANAALANTVTVSAANDPNPANNTSTATTDVRLPTDVSITMTDSADPIYVGQSLVYRLTVFNAGPGSAGSAVATVPLSADVDFVSASSECIQANGTVTCEFGPLASGASATRQIEVRPTAPDAALAGEATVVGGGDTNLDNNLATAVTQVLDPPPILGIGPLTTTPAVVTAPATAAAAAPTAQTPALVASAPPKKPTLTVTAKRNGRNVTLSLAVANLTPAKATVSVKLRRGTRTIAGGNGALKAGKRKLTLTARKTVKKGTYRLAVAVTQSGKTTNLRATLKLK